MNKANSEIEELFEVAVSSWERQGRTAEQKWAVRNFTTGKGVLLINDIRAIIKQRVIKGQIEILRSLFSEGRLFSHDYSEKEFRTIVDMKIKELENSNGKVI